MLLMNIGNIRNPDIDYEEKYHWDKEFQRHILSLIISDVQFVLQAIDLINPTYFTYRPHSIICKVIFKYFKKYNSLPHKDFVVQEIHSEVRNEEELDKTLIEFHTVRNFYQPGLHSRDYLTNKIVYFAKIQSFKRLFQRGIDLLHQNPESEDTWNQIYQLMENMVLTSKKFDIGMDYFKTIEERYTIQEEELYNEENIFCTGIRSVDEAIQTGGYSRGEIFSVVGAPGCGKSVFLANLAYKNIIQGKKGLYISLELAEEKVAHRLDAIITGIGTTELIHRKDEVIKRLSELQENGGGGEDCLFIIKQFPAGSATVHTIKAYIYQAKFYGFKPDFVIVDYVGEMADIPGIPKYESREELVRQLRALATEENVFVATAMQPNRSHKEEHANIIDDKHLADSYGQLRPLDGCISLNQSQLEKNAGVGRGYVIKQREGPSNYKFYYRFDKDNLRMEEIDGKLYATIVNTYQDKSVQEIEIDKIENKDHWEDY